MGGKRLDISTERSTEAQIHAGWTRPVEYRGETMDRADIAEEARLAGIRRRRIEDILEASRLERDAFLPVWEL